MIVNSQGTNVNQAQRLGLEKQTWSSEGRWECI